MTLVSTMINDGCDDQNEPKCVRGHSTPNLSSVPTAMPLAKYIPPHRHHPVVKNVGA